MPRRLQSSCVATLYMGKLNQRVLHHLQISELEERTAQDEAFAALVIPSCGFQRPGAGRPGVTAVSGVPSTSTISRVRYGFSLWQLGHRRLKTWDFRCDDSAPSLAACRLPTMEGTGMGAVQCRHITPRKVGRSVSMVILVPRRDRARVLGSPNPTPKRLAGSSRMKTRTVEIRERTVSRSKLYATN
jgi:hypothetical protein